MKQGDDSGASCGEGSLEEPADEAEGGGTEIPFTGSSGAILDRGDGGCCRFPGDAAPLVGVSPLDEVETDVVCLDMV